LHGGAILFYHHGPESSFFDIDVSEELIDAIHQSQGNRVMAMSALFLFSILADSSTKNM
jgi:hypothetical protein